MHPSRTRISQRSKQEPNEARLLGLTKYRRTFFFWLLRFPLFVLRLVYQGAFTEVPTNLVPHLRAYVINNKDCKTKVLPRFSGFRENEKQHGELGGQLCLRSS